jgi:hypothetical protein
VLEHILLRPKKNENVFVPIVAGKNGMIAGATPPGILEYTKMYSIAGVIPASNSFLVTGSALAAELSPLMMINIKGSDLDVNDGDYKIISVTVNGSSNTVVKVYPTIPSSAVIGNGKIYYRRTKAITSIDTFEILTLAEGTGVVNIPKDYPATITGSANPANDGTYNIYDVTAGMTGTVKLTFDKKRLLVRDNFLPVNLDAECEDCKVEDPYSFTASVVLPYWQGRFLNQDFRKFFERALRTECPAHIALNICWISCDQMQEFEAKFKLWQAENARLVEEPGARSNSLNVLIDILERLRSVYPTGTLHDCESDPDLQQNSIILNRTAIGTIQL